MTLESPAWLLLLPVLAAAGWFWRGLALWRPLRAAVLVLLVVVLARPRVRMQADGMDLWVLLDRSESTEDRIDRGLPEWTKLLKASARSREDEIHLADYAQDAVIQEQNGGGLFTGNRKHTRTDVAIDSILAARHPEKAARILIFTDGYSTAPLTGIADRLRQANVPLDIRLLPEPPGTDYRVRSVRMPVSARAGEPFLIEAEVTGPGDGEVPLSILRNGTSILETKAVLVQGRGVARFTDRAGVTGAYHYEARISPAGDAHPGNNRSEAWIEVTGSPRLLLVTGYTNDPVAEVLRKQFTVEVVDRPQMLQAGQLTGCRAVIINNVPAWEIPSPFLASLEFFVNVQGGGLMMAGGKRSFGAGGYFRSPVDELLPVSMELKKDQRKLMSAIALVLDRSGSMAASAGAGQTKMDLANEGAAKTIEFMGYQDFVTVYAVDSEAHSMVPLQMVGDGGNKEELMDRARRITSSGGGIFVYNGLKAGWKALRQTPAGIRHLILFADAADAEQPGDGPGADYQTLLEEAVKEGATCSVIALGTEADTDAGFLKDVAARGNGRIFFTDRPSDLPNIFTAETIAVTRNTFISDPTETLVSGQWQEVSPRAMDWLPQVDGYNLNYGREWASVAMAGKDEYTAPLVAWGRRGAGRSLAVCFPLGGEFSERTRAWPAYGDFLQTAGRWLMGDEVPADIGFRWDLTGTTLGIDLMYAGEWEQTFSQTPPRILLASGSHADQRREAAWERIAPGHYRAGVELEEGEVVRGAIQAGSHALPFGPVTAGSNAEWAFDPARVEELRQVAAQSGGRELVALDEVWQSPPLRELTDLRRWLLPLALLLVLADALVTRLGWTLWKKPVLPALAKKVPGAVPAFRRPRPSPRHPSRQPAPVVKAAEPFAEAPPPQPPPAKTEGADAGQRRSRYARAKKR